MFIIPNTIILYDIKMSRGFFYLTNIKIISKRKTRKIHNFNYDDFYAECLHNTPTNSNVCKAFDVSILDWSYRGY